MPTTDLRRRSGTGPSSARSRRPLVRAMVGGIVAALGLTVLSSTTPAAADEPPIVGPLASSSVTADPLPTAQINGVGWTQLVVGNTVYVGGEFTQARPAGAKRSATTRVTRSNLLSYDIRTGKLTSWAPIVKGAVRALALSPDGKRLYAGGDISSVGGVPLYRLAAFDIATGKLVRGFAPPFDYTVNAIVPSGTSVYVGGAFNYVGNATRKHLAAVTASTGALTAWAPRADGLVSSMVRVPNGGPLVVGGSFGTLEGSTSGQQSVARGLGALKAGTGDVVPWPANQRVQNYGDKAGITSLRLDGTTIYGTGYVFGGSGNLEGTFATDSKGNLRWVEDCHGDTYDSYGMGSLVYTVGHAHDCGRINGFVEQVTSTAHRALAFTKAVKGTLGTNTVPGYANWAGTPAPALTSWFPDLSAGSYTGQVQAAWSVSGNGTYVVMAGEFPQVGGVPQEGLVRFALRTVAPNKVGPVYADKPPFTLTASRGAVRMDFKAASDVDDLVLTYTIVRDDTVIGTLKASSTFWNRPDLSFTDSKVTSGDHEYKLKTTDPDGNSAWTQAVSVTVPS